MYTSAEDYAVYVRSLQRSYGKTKVLHGIDMTVAKGSIYGLLGPSGCGKTTLLKVLLGRLVPEKGSTVNVLGSLPGVMNAPCPGTEVGYMPQDIALYQEMTIGEVLRFHSRLHGMDRAEYDERMASLLKFLELPDESRIIANLSGGQQRRVSLAVALLHRPELLILDEPTVGVDPLLRENIWLHLREIAATGVTIVITTHYIEEARMADRVGLMRNGRLIAEDSPEALMKQHKFNSLEETFLFLCRSMDAAGATALVEKHSESASKPTALYQQADAAATSKASGVVPRDGGHVQSESAPLLQRRRPQKVCRSFGPRPRHTFAVTVLGFTRLRHLYSLLVFDLIIPTIQICLFCIAIGPDPTGLQMALVNLDVGSDQWGNLGNQFVVGMNTDVNSLVFQPFGTMDQAVASVQAGHTWGAIYIPANFSECLPLRQITTDELVYNLSTIHVKLDMSDFAISTFIERRLAVGFQEMMAYYLKNQSEPAYLGNLPVHQGEPVYGEENPRFIDFLAPGLIIITSFAHCIGLTAVAFVQERSDGTMDRVFAAGGRASEVIMGHTLTSLVLILIQSALMLIFALLVFKVPLHGNLFIMFLFVILLGLNGTVYGLVISSVTQKVHEAMQMALGSFFPIMLLSGILWPKQAIPIWLGWITYILPTAWAAEAMRSVMIRGWGVTFADIWQALLVTIGWTIVLLLLAMRFLRTRQ